MARAPRISFRICLHVARALGTPLGISLSTWPVHLADHVAAAKAFDMCKLAVHGRVPLKVDDSNSKEGFVQNLSVILIISILKSVFIL